MKRGKENVKFHESNDSRTTKGVDEDQGNKGKENPDGYQNESNELDAMTMRKILTSLFDKTLDTKKKQKENPHHRYEGVYKESSNIVKPPLGSSRIYSGDSIDPSTSTTTIPSTTKNVASTTESSAEVFQDVLKKLNSLGTRGEQVLRRLVDEVDRRNSEAEHLRQMLSNVMKNDSLTLREKKRLKRQLVLGSPVHDDFVQDDSEDDAAVEKEDLFPDGIADDRGTVNETNLNDRSNSEFWSSFSSSEERLLECKGLVLNLPLNPHVHCSPKYEDQHARASMANTITYRVPTDGYYFFVFNSENEIQPNYVRIKFDLVKTMYNTSNPVNECKNTTKECAFHLNFFSGEKTVLELPVNGNESQWNEEYVVVSTCEPRTSVYLICIISVPLLILLFAFH